MQGYDVVPVPGANAAISALVASGLVPQPFYVLWFFITSKKGTRHVNWMI